MALACRMAIADDAASRPMWAADAMKVTAVRTNSSDESCETPNRAADQRLMSPTNG